MSFNELFGILSAFLSRRAIGMAFALGLACDETNQTGQEAKAGEMNDSQEELFRVRINNGDGAAVNGVRFVFICAKPCPTGIKARGRRCSAPRRGAGIRPDRSGWSITHLEQFGYELPTARRTYGFYARGNQRIVRR